MDALVHGRARRRADGPESLSIVAVTAREAVAEAVRRHGARPTAAAALGRTMVGALCLTRSLGHQGAARVLARLEGGGPLGGTLADASRDGSIRGYVANPGLDLVPRESDGKLDVGRAVGRNGTIAVTWTGDNGEPFSSMTGLVNGEVGEDLANFLVRSEQTPSAVAVGVRVRRAADDPAALEVVSAGGVLVQAYSEGDEDALGIVSANLARLGQVSSVLASGGLAGLISRLTTGLVFEQRESVGVRFHCHCDQRRAVFHVSLFSPEERAEMIADGGAEAVCHFCGSRYWVSPDELRALQPVEEAHCPDCGALWVQVLADGRRTAREEPSCRCGRPVVLPS